MNTNTDEMRKMIDADVARLREVLNGQHGEDEKRRVMKNLTDGIIKDLCERQRVRMGAGCMWSVGVDYGADGKCTVRVRSIPESEWRRES